MSHRRILITGGSGFIGTNYVDQLSTISDVNITNIDWAAPKKPSHTAYWARCDILNSSALLKIAEKASPTELIHLAARTDMKGRTVEDYAVNSVGTRNVVEVARAVRSIRRVIFTSTQYVVGPGSLPENELDFRPHTVYGHSKVLGEKIVRDASLPCCWTIVRPTNVWGSWHPRYSDEFWRILKRGRYIHPGTRPVMRSYGYVRTVIAQMEKILSSPEDNVREKIFYVGDPSLSLLDWVNAFSIELTARPVKVVPRWLVRILAVLGDSIKACGIDFPIFTSRYRNMIEDYTVPMETTFAVLGRPQISLIEGVRETVDWLREQDESWR